MSTAPSLIQCPACQNSVSTAASSCPRCGQPLANAGAKAASNPLQIIGIGLAILGTILTFVGLNRDMRMMAGVGIVAGLIGLLLFGIHRMIKG